jgi:predicted SAM-dependent methyltransferase
MNRDGNIENGSSGHRMKTYVKSALVALHLDGPARRLRDALNGRLHGAIGRGSPIWQSETSKCRARLAPHCTGCGVDLGPGGDPITPHAIRVDLPQPYSHVGTLPVQLSGKAENLYWFRDGVLDFVYSSHLLEDYPDTEAVLREWLRVLKPLGNLIIFCPDEQVYRKHCAATGQGYNTHHVHVDFSLDFVKRILDRIGQTEVLHETPLTDIYSWELVCRKKPDAPAEVSR